MEQEGHDGGQQADEGRLAALTAAMPLARRLGITIERAERAEVRGRIAHEPGLCTSGGLLHGGALMSLADTVGAVCAFLNLPEGAGTTTIESKTNFFRAVRQGTVEACARPLHAGRTVIAVQTEIRDEEGRLVALTTQTQAVLQR